MKQCAVCGNVNITSVERNEELEYKGHFLIIDNYKYYQCNSCGEEFVDEKFEKSIEKKLRDFHRNVEGLLSSHDIQVIRKSLGFTQEVFGEVLGGGKKAFARYENGTVTQSKPMDNLLRILRDRPEALESITEMKVSNAWLCGVEPIQYNPEGKILKYNFRVA